MPEWLKNTVLKRPLGSVMLPAIITMIVLSYATLSLVQIQAAGLAEAANHAEKLKSEHLFLAGIEFSYALLNNGQSPATNGDRTLGSGNINVTANPSTENVTVKGEVLRPKNRGQRTCPSARVASSLMTITFFFLATRSAIFKTFTFEK